MGLGRYLIFFLIKFPVEWRQNHVWGPIFDPSYDHIYKCDYFGYTDGRTVAASTVQRVQRAQPLEMQGSLRGFISIYIYIY